VCDLAWVADSGTVPLTPRSRVFVAVLDPRVDVTVSIADGVPSDIVTFRCVRVTVAVTKDVRVGGRRGVMLLVGEGRVHVTDAPAETVKETVKTLRSTPGRR
jgi:ethanolamine ammonia-lyase small subunit